MVFVAYNQPPEVLKPCKQAFYLPSASITPQFPAVLGFWLFPAFTMRGDHFNTTIVKELVIKFIAVVGLVANQLVGCILGKTGVYGILNKLYLVGRSAFHVSGDRKTSSVCDCHDLGAFATLCLADSKTPFFAGAKLPSINASRISILPRSLRSSTSSMAMRRNTPCRTHCWNRRWHVWYGGYRWGKSFQGAPVRMIHKIPLRTSRGFLAGRPLGSLDGVDASIIGSIRFHCSFVSSILIILHIQDVMSRFIFNFFKHLQAVIRISYNFSRLRCDLSSAKYYFF